MALSNFFRSYNKHVTRLLRGHDEAKAMSLAVGGDFEAVGLTEYYLLLQHGLQKHHSVIDVGCGSGRLAVHLRDYLEGHYLGIDVVPELYAYAEKLARRPDWTFTKAPGLTIPVADASADFICFFSVFTHLTHEESYRYLEDARRVLKPDGRIVLSFIEFRIPSHWIFFQHDLAGKKGEDIVLNQFMSRDGLEAWAAHLGLAIVEMADGDKPHIPLPQPVKWANGAVHESLGHLGQSVCVLKNA